jgi:hypothetical protein
MNPRTSVYSPTLNQPLVKARSTAQLAFLFLLFSVRLMDAEPALQGGEIVVVENQVDRSRPQASWAKSTAGDRIQCKEQIRTVELSRAAIELSTGSVLRLSELTNPLLQPSPTGQENGRSKINFRKGVTYFFSRSDEETGTTFAMESVAYRAQANELLVPQIDWHHRHHISCMPTPQGPPWPGELRSSRITVPPVFDNFTKSQAPGSLVISKIQLSAFQLFTPLTFFQPSVWFPAFSASLPAKANS